MNIGDVVWSERKLHKSSGYIPAGETFHVDDFPELAEIFEWQHGYPDGVKRMATPLIHARDDGMIPHFVGKLHGQEACTTRREESECSSSRSHQ
jgi:hypothetical protein